MSRQNDDIKDEIVFLGGMNTDDDPRFLPKGDYIDAVNVTRAEDGSGGIIVNMKGNKSVYSPVADEEYICGWAYYGKNESVILLIYYIDSAVPGNKIIEYNPQTDIDTIIINDTDLNFSNPKTTDYFIKVDILSDWMGWVDSTNPPRIINLEDIGSVADLSTYIDLHKIRPTASSGSKHIPPLVSLGLDSVKVYNNLRTGYQFKYRYIYNDFRPSTWSPGSDLAISQVLTRSGNDVNFLGSENYIKVQFNANNANVGYVDIAVREGNIGNWFRIVKIKKNDPENVYDSTDTTLQTSVLSNNTDYIYRFYDNEGRIAISDEEANKAYDVIPDKSETLSFIGDNRLTLGGNTEGKDLIDIDVTLTAQYTNVDIVEDWLSPGRSYQGQEAYIDFVLTGTLFDTYDRVLPSNYIHFNYDFRFTDSSGIFPIVSDYIFVFNDIIEGLDNIGQYIADNYPISGILSSVSYTAGTNTLRFTYTNPTDAFTGIGTITIDASLIYTSGYDFYDSYGYINDLGFKRTTRPKLALIYEDKYGIKYPALTSTDTEVEIESYAASSAGFAHIQYTINNIAPSDAVAYRWAYAYKPKSFTQVVITDVSEFENANGTLNTQLLALDISGDNQFFPANYTIEAGDRIRIIKEGGTYDVIGDGGYVDDTPEFVVEELKYTINDGTDDIGGLWLIVRPSNVSGYAISDIGTPSKFMNAIIEIYKQETEDIDYRFYEIGSGGYCVGGTTNHDDWYTGNATGYINQGDVWYRPVTIYKRSSVTKDDITSTMLYLESPYPYDNAPRKDVGIADINIEIPESESKYTNTIRWSNKFFQNTQINGLSTFDSDSKEDISDKFGRIKGLEELGNSLVFICEEKVLSAFVGATEYTDAEGNINVVKSTLPIGYIRPHAEDYGTFLKESILNTGKYIYFFDLYNKVVVRKASNGLFPISGKSITPTGIMDYKMRTYFKQLSDGLISSLNDGGSPDYADVKIFMGYDKYYHDVYITFSDRIDNSNNVSLIFNEDLNRWISRYSSYNVSPGVRGGMYAFTKTQLMGFNETDYSLYLFNSDAVNRTTFFGQKFYPSIKFTTAGELSNVIKIFNTIGVHSDDAWDINADNSIIIPKNDSYPEMSSKIPEGRWRLEEGVYYSEFLRNMKSTSSSLKLIDLYTGNFLRGYVMIIEMTNDNDDIVKLFKVDTLSELSV